jgi:hypothetical protein
MRWTDRLEADPLPWLLVSAAIDAGVVLLLARPRRRRLPDALGFTPGFPLGYTADVVQNLDVLAELGYATDPGSSPPWSGSWPGRPEAGGSAATPTTAGPWSTSSARASRPGG